MLIPLVIEWPLRSGRCRTRKSTRSIRCTRGPWRCECQNGSYANGDCSTERTRKQSSSSTNTDSGDPTPAEYVRPSNWQVIDCNKGLGKLTPGIAGRKQGSPHFGYPSRGSRNQALAETRKVLIENSIRKFFYPFWTQYSPILQYSLIPSDDPTALIPSNP